MQRRCKYLSAERWMVPLAGLEPARLAALDFEWAETMLSIWY